MTDDIQRESSEAMDARLEQCQERIGYRFKDLNLLRASLTHASGADHRLASNERLEFLGDAILGAVVCETLFRQFPKSLEGDLTKIKSVVVSRQTCAKLSNALGLEEFLILGKGMASDPQLPQSLMADVFESLLAAIYLDGGDAASREFIARNVNPEIVLASTGASGTNHKSILQQEAQRKRGLTPTYQLMDEKGPDHSKCFMIAAQVGDKRYSPAWGTSKKEAEQRAAENAISEIAGNEPPHGTE